MIDKLHSLAMLFASKAEVSKSWAHQMMLMAARNTLALRGAKADKKKEISYWLYRCSRGEEAIRIPFDRPLIGHIMVFSEATSCKVTSASIGFADILYYYLYASQEALKSPRANSLKIEDINQVLALIESKRIDEQLLLFQGRREPRCN